MYTVGQTIKYLISNVEVECVVEAVRDDWMVVRRVDTTEPVFVRGSFHEESDFEQFLQKRHTFEPAPPKPAPTPFEKETDHKNFLKFLKANGL